MANGGLWQSCEWHPNGKCDDAAGGGWECEELPQTTAKSDGNSGVATADPVSSASGELYSGVTDLSLGGPYPPLSFERYYGSFLMNEYEVRSSMGINWMHNFDLRLIVDGDEAKVVYYGGKIIELEQSGGDWDLVNPEPVPFQFKEEPGKYLLMDPSRDLIYAFDTDGRLRRIESRSGKHLELTYSVGSLVGVSDGLGRTLSFSYPSGKLERVEDQSGRFITFSYSNDNLYEYTDARGNTTRYQYAVAGVLGRPANLPGDGEAIPGLIASTELPEGNTPYSQNYNSEGRVTDQTDGEGNTTGLFYNTPSSGITRVIDPLGYSVEHTHDGDGKLTRYKDQEGRSIYIGYDGNNRRSSVTDRLGETTTITYHGPSGKPAAYTDALGNTTAMSYTAQAQDGFTFYNLTRVDYPDGTFVTMTYDAAGNMVSLTDRGGYTWSYTYNSLGQVLNATNPAGGVTTYAYKEDATVDAVTDPSGNTTTFAYDALKRVSMVTRPDAAFQSFTYDENDNLLTLTDERGNTTVTTYDANGMVETVTDPLGHTSSFAYDENNRLISSIDPLGMSWDMTYDELGRVSTSSNPLGETSTLGYSPQGWLTSLTDPGGKTINWTHDWEGVISSATDPLLNSWGYTTDAVGRVTRRTTPLTHTHDYAYDAMGRLTSYTDPLARNTAYTYGNRGQLSGITLPEGISAAYARNSLGRIILVTDPGGNAWNYSYDTMGRATSASDPLANTVTYGYDSRSRISTVTYPAGYQSITYDAAGNMTRRLYSDGTDLQYSYDDNGRLLAADGLALSYDARGDIIGCNGLSVGRDDAGRISSITLAPGKTVTYTYNSRGLASEVSDWVGGTTSLAYDDAGRLVSLTRPNGVVTQYAYDPDGRVTGIVEQNGGTLASTTLTRNGAGETASATRDVPLQPALSTETRTFSYDAAGQVSGFTYDGMGRLIGDGTRTYTWDLASRLQSYDEGGGAVSFTYDALGMRTSRSFGGVTRSYVWNYALGLPSVSVVKQGGSDLRYYVHLPGGMLLYSIEAAGNTRRFYHYDEMGTTLFLTDEGGTVTDGYGVTPYGDMAAKSGSADNPFVWVGAYGVMREGDSGLYYMRARYYDSGSGRFISRDPVRSLHPSKINPYQYASGNPGGNIDPVGLDDTSAQALREKALKQARIWDVMNKISYYSNIAYGTSSDITARDRINALEKLNTYEKALKKLQGGNAEAKKTTPPLNNARGAVEGDEKPIEIRGELRVEYPGVQEYDKSTGKLILRPEIRWNWGDRYDNTRSDNLLRWGLRLQNPRPAGHGPTTPPKLPGPEEWDEDDPSEEPDFEGPEAWGDPSCIL